MKVGFLLFSGIK